MTLSPMARRNGQQKRPRRAGAHLVEHGTREHGGTQSGPAGSMDCVWESRVLKEPCISKMARQMHGSRAPFMAPARDSDELTRCSVPR